MSDAKKKRIRRIVFWSCVAVLLLLNIATDCSLDDSGSLCISFDKWDMTTADKVVIFDGEQQYTVTDADFVRNLTREAVVACDTNRYCCANDDVDTWIEIYKGDRLIRHMRWIQNHDALAYEADLAHWVLFGEEGHVFLSSEVRRALYKIIGKEVFF